MYISRFFTAFVGNISCSDNYRASCALLSDGNRNWAALFVVSKLCSATPNFMTIKRFM
jgi:hypothetical protein